MKKLSLLFTGLFLSIATTLLAGHITIGTPGGTDAILVHGTWPAGDSVIVYQHMVIPVDSTLRIQEGVNVLIADTTQGIELIALGNLICKGTAENPVNFTIKSDMLPSRVPSVDPFPGLWGSIMCDTTCNTMLILHANFSYFGAVTQDNSPSVLLHLFKNAAGETTPAINYRDHNGGKLVIEYCTFHNGTDDAVYVEGGNMIYAYNTTYQNGSTGGEAMDIKAGTIADCAYNLVYSQNTNAFKLSNTGSRSPQANVVVYNNTILNTGWRRPTVKGGSVWYESGVIGKTYNTLFANTRFGIKTNGSADTACKGDYNFYYAYGANGVFGFTSAAGLFDHGAHDIVGASAGDNDPMFENYPLSTDTLNSVFDMDWDFHLKAGSPAIGTGTLNVPRHFGTNGITIDGVMYTSPEPSATIGAFSEVATAVKNITGEDNAFSIFPNPVESELNIRFNATEPQTKVKIYSSTGQLLMNRNIETGKGRNTVPISLDKLEKGMYFINFQNGSQNQTKPFIKK
jgi:hypothetical protein